ncbi:hypothetical protein SAMN04488503_2120 [Humidesulfovibrio mexicanus]|uniref:Lysozyme inhibitor LprI N-terminal domain-containing protein n=1 Tax=Humidesulfovibrio mexicanus TaxID=147047 RepID=A0A239APP0_9BACT|nr:hypothetical protein [Humidesulfovibrio mexicanus]SNR97262.1 hypothetical protein SAMN04488503_2120 [Humidesulfovibrio mexicanus]
MKNGLCSICACAASVLLFGLAHAAEAQLETEHLRVQDTTCSLGEQRLSDFAERAEASLGAVLALWGLDAQVSSQGKIRVLYDEPLRGQCTATFFQPGGRVPGGARSLRVFGCAEAPLMLAHKLTSALMPQPDKLLRNMAGALSEQRVGDPMSFPACGQDVDDWVRAAVRSGTRIPLAELGPGHASWGMRDEGGGRLRSFDRQRQLRAYAEAASFAKYLADTYGLEALKRLQRLSHTSGARPWREALGADLDELEARWLDSLREGSAGREERVGRLVRVLNAGVGDPCERARREGPTPPPRPAP